MEIEANHILVIDDNEDILFMLKAMLQLKGYKVSIKENADNIESVIKKLLPDIILMDMLLSGTDGREICQKIKANPTISSTPVIMISAHPNAGRKCLEAGADYFISKPFEMNDLFETVSDAFIKKNQ